uniref:Isopenicillin N synthase-like Fe(2+) 2OG dioxygenase domain-containing protein n=1 Tax=Salmo trutta TaxID=8032 RepID=A0A674B3K7_SALTR
MCSNITVWLLLLSLGSGLEVDGVMNISNTLFLKPDEMKLSFSRKSFSNNPNHGWVSSETESLNPKRPGDLKEAFNTASLHPDIVNNLSVCLDVVAISIKKPYNSMHKDYFKQSLFFLHLLEEHCDENSSTLRSLYYPPVRSDWVKEGHITLFISAPSIPGTVLINVADLMQRWTTDVFVSVVHRVLLPPAGDWSTLQSLAFFVQMDVEALITCCDGSNKYPQVKAGSYLIQHVNDFYRSEGDLL